MAQYQFTTAAGSIAASATNPNVLAGDRVSQAPYPRTLQGLAVIIRDNTPAALDVSWELYAGPQLIASGDGLVARTTGAEVANPDDFTPIGTVLPPNAVLQLKVVNNDSGAAHGIRAYFLLDRI